MIFIITIIFTLSLFFAFYLFDLFNLFALNLFDFTTFLNSFDLFNFIHNSLSFDLLFSFINFDLYTICASSIISLPKKSIKKLKASIKQILSEEGISPKTIIKTYGKTFGVDFIQSIISEYFEEKASLSKEEKLAKRQAKAAQKKAALQSFLNSDLYSVACGILGFDIKQKFKSIALNSKWLTIRNYPSVNPEEFTMSNYYTFDIEAYLDEKGNFVPYLFGLYGPDLGYKSFYGFNSMADGVNFILNHNYSSMEVTFYVHNGAAFDFIFLI
jgi:hypothetical protein